MEALLTRGQSCRWRWRKQVQKTKIVTLKIRGGRQILFPYRKLLEVYLPRKLLVFFWWDRNMAMVRGQNFCNYLGTTPKLHDFLGQESFCLSFARSILSFFANFEPPKKAGFFEPKSFHPVEKNTYPVRNGRKKDVTSRLE